MPNKKIFILLPDGVGLRNFAFSNFYQLGIDEDFAITYWNATPFDLKDLGFEEIKIQNSANWVDKGIHALQPFLMRVVDKS